MPLPISELEGAVQAFFTDLDGTLTTDGRVEASTLSRLEDLVEGGIPLVVVTGRPAGWGQALMTLLPSTAVVAENGGVIFLRHETGVQRIYGVPEAELMDWRLRMRDAAADVARAIPGARVSSDSVYREVDYAIDWNEEASLSHEDAKRVVAMLEERGFAAVRSSVHVNFNAPHFDKLSACKEVVRRALAGDASDLSPYVYVGDALNDAPMFRGFPRSIGVANVRDWWHELPHEPAFVTRSREGAGLREVVERILAL